LAAPATITATGHARHLHQSKDKIDNDHEEEKEGDEEPEQEEQQQEHRDAAKKNQKGINRPEAVAARATYVPQKGCPVCTPDIACAHYVEKGVECHSSGAHGGAGIILSIGLMRKMTHEGMQK
jgi:hypothetical protein